MTFQVSLENIGQFASQFWKQFSSSKVFAVHGPMGAGKTTIITALCKARGVHDIIGSPTFSIINEYSLTNEGKNETIYHIDLYRLKDHEEIVQAGVEDCIYSGAICFVEWPEKAPYLFENDAVHIHITPIDETHRTVEINRNL